MPPAPSVSPSHSPGTKGKDRAATSDDATVKTDETTAAMDNTTTPADGGDDPATSSNSMDNGGKAKDIISASTRRKARKNWAFLKSLHSSQKKSQKQLFKMGENISLTTAEATFLNMVTESRLDVDHRSFTAGGGGIGAAAAAVSAEYDAEEAAVRDGAEGGAPNDELSVSGRSHFTHLVQAAMAKERLRKAITARLSSLSGAEAKFLTKLVDNKNVTLEALKNAVSVLDNDPMYNPELRKDDLCISERYTSSTRSRRNRFRYNKASVHQRPIREEMRITSKSLSEDDDEDRSPLKAEKAEVEDSRSRMEMEADESHIGEIKLEDDEEMEAEEDDDSGDEEEAEEDDIEDRRSMLSRRASMQSIRHFTELLDNSRHSARHLKDLIKEDEIDDEDGNEEDSAGVQSARHFDKLLDESGHSRKLLDGMDTSDHSTGGLDTSLPETQLRRYISAPEGRKAGRRSSLTEADDVWEAALGNVADEEEDDEDNMQSMLSRSERHTSSTRGRRGRGRHAGRKHCVHERKVWSMVHSEAIREEPEVKLAETRSLDIDEDGLPLKSSKVGEAIDPLLAAVPVEKTPRVGRRLRKVMDEEKEQAGESVDEKKVGLDQLLSSQVDAPRPPAMDGAQDEPVQPKASGGDASFVVEDSQANPMLVCCGVDSMNLFDDIMTVDKPEAVDDAKPEEEEVPREDFSLDDSLASKKRYLHLNSAKVQSMRSAKLSTWMGAPEDYPILGVKRKKRVEEDDDAGESKDGDSDDGVDPLEPHVLSPLLMKCLRDHLPYALREENFWLKYSLARDGASLDVIFQTMRHSQHTILAIETTNGEVFGSFTSSPWRANGNNYYGSCEAFVWMLRKTRDEACGSLDEYVLRESSLDVFRWNGRGRGNRNVQLSNERQLFVGGGDPDEDVERTLSGFHEFEVQSDEEGGEEWGMALALDDELLRGTSSRCATFASNPLIDSSRHEGSEVFEIMNMEIWALTPCMDEEMAEELELGRTFVMGFHKQT